LYNDFTHILINFDLAVFSLQLAVVSFCKKDVFWLVFSLMGS